MLAGHWSSAKRDLPSCRHWRSLAGGLATIGLAACGDATGPDTGPEIDGYTGEEIDYFAEVAFGAEFGGASARLRKWRQSIRIKTHGDPTAEDEATLTEVVEELDDLIDVVQLELTDNDADIDIHFAPESEFSDILPDYIPTNLGFFWVWWNASSEIVRSVILITTEQVTQQERSHLIREELTQSLGLMRDSPRFPGSIFQQAWTATTEYAPIDRVLIEMLYREELTPGMTRDAALSVLGDLPRLDGSASQWITTPTGLSRSRSSTDTAGSAGGS